MANVTCQYGIIPLNLPSYRYSMACFFTVGAVTSGSLNFLVLLSIRKNPSLHKLSYILLATIAAADFLAGFFGEIMMAITSVFIVKVMENKSRSWLNLTCQLMIACKAFGYIVCGVSISTLIGMSVDRFLAITMKTRYINNSTILKGMGFYLLASWILIITFSLYFSIDVTPYKIKLVFFVVGLSIATAISTIVIFYTMAYWKLKKLCSALPSASNNAGNNRINMAKYRKTFFTFVLVCVFLLVCYAPFVLASFIVFSNGMDSIPNDQAIDHFVFLDVAELLMYWSATVNPILYVWNMRKLRNAMKNIVKKTFCFSRIGPENL